MANTDITIAGSFIADLVKTTDCYPQAGMMAYITDTKRAAGGCVPNTAVSLKKIDKETKVSVRGKIGKDENGSFIIDALKQNDVNCDKVILCEEAPTSYCDVMSQPSGERTFFHAKGANALFGEEDLDVSSLDCEIFHIGYIFLLDYFEKADAEYGNVLARVLKKIQDKGIKTSIDVVSESSGRYKEIIIPTLKYCNFAIMNEVESSMLTDLSPYNADGSLNVENIRKTMEFMADCGVKEKVIVHCKNAGFILDCKTGEFTLIPSINVPKEEIKGSVGAGDAFCAGCLYGLLKGMSDNEILKTASAVAASNLFSKNSTDSIISIDQIENFERKYGRKTI